jgi:hypothetical protein
MILSRSFPSASRLLPALAGDRPGLRQAAVSHALFGVLPVLLTLDILYYTFHHGHIDAIDFHHEFWPAAQRVLHGLSPYNRSWMNISGGVAFPYPAFTAVAFIPLALLNHALADWVFTGVNILAALLTLRVLNVRDWRLYGLVLLWSPVVNGWQTANLTLLLGLGIACLWRKRDNPLAAGALIAVMISLKPFVWPLGLWLLATRRYRALAYAAACALALNVASWAVIGFNELHAYSALVSAVNHVMDQRGYSIMSLVMHVGGASGIAYALGLAVAGAIGAACLIVGRRGDARSALALSVGVCLLGTPVLWTHYFALLIVPLALFRPRLDRLWLLPLVFWVCPAIEPAPWQMVIALVISTIVLGCLLRHPPPHSVSTEPDTISASLVPELAMIPSRS